MMHTVTGTCTVAVYSIKWVFVDRNVHIDFTGSCGRDFHSSFVLHLFSLKYWKLSTCNMGMLANVLSDVIIILITIIQKALLLNDESSLSLQWVVFLGLMAAKENTTIELETQPYNSYSMTQWTVLFQVIISLEHFIAQTSQATTAGNTTLVKWQGPWPWHL